MKSLELSVEGLLRQYCFERVPLEPKHFTTFNKLIKIYDVLEYRIVQFEDLELKHFKDAPLFPRNIAILSPIFDRVVFQFFDVKCLYASPNLRGNFINYAWINYCQIRHYLDVGEYVYIHNIFQLCGTFDWVTPLFSRNGYIQSILENQS